MSEQALPEPPYPADVRARGWQFELDMERIEQSDTWLMAPDDMRPWLLMLWARAWTSSPCGSLPANRLMIARRIGMSPGAFELNAEVLLRGWYLASDGRLYHRVVTEIVERMRDGRRFERERKQRQREQARANQGETPSCPTGHPRDSSVTPAGVAPLVQEQEQVIQSPSSLRSEGDSSTAGSSTPPSTDPPAGKTRARVKASIPECPYQAIVDTFHDVLPELPSVRLLDDKRKAEIRKVWVWAFTSRKPDGSPRATETVDSGLAWFRSYFDLARSSDFLMGRSRRSAGHESWRCTIDYLCSNKGMKHVIEGLQ